VLIQIVVTDTGTTGFARIPPEVHPPVFDSDETTVIFHLRDRRGLGPDLDGERAGTTTKGEVAVTLSIQDDGVPGFLDFIAQNGGDIIPKWDTDRYQAAAAEWDGRCPGARFVPFHSPN